MSPIFYADCDMCRNFHRSLAEHCPRPDGLSLYEEGREVMKRDLLQVLLNTKEDDTYKNWRSLILYELERIMSSSSSSSDSEEEVQNRSSRNRTKSRSSSVSSEASVKDNENKRPKSRSSSSSSVSSIEDEDGNNSTKNATVVEVIDKDESSTYVPWDAKDRLSLIEGVLDQIKPRDVTPFDRFKVNWKKINIDKPKEDCQRMWEELKSKARQYRTIREVAEELLLGTQTTNPAVEEWNNKVGKGGAKISKGVRVKKRGGANISALTGQCYPTRAPTSYELFKKTTLKEIRESGIPSNQWFRKLSEKWNGMDGDKKKEYEEASHEARLDYVNRLTEYCTANPNDTKIEKTLNTERKKVELYKKNASMLDVTDNHKIEEYMSRTPPASLKKKLKFSSDSEQEKPTKTTDSPKKKFTATSENKETPKQTGSRKRAASESDSYSDTHQEETHNIAENNVSDSEKEEEENATKKKKKSQAKSDQEEFTSPKKKKKNKVEQHIKEEQVKTETSPQKKKKVKLEMVEEVSETSPVKSPKKKKKKVAEAANVWTGVDIFLDLKKDVYQMSHSDMSEDTLLAKMRSKYNKLPEKKQRKYEQLAEQRNIDS